MIQIDRVHKHYPGGNAALKDVSFSVNSGSMVFLTGRSGAGKSTLLRLIALLERQTRGKILISGINLSSLKGDRIAHYRRRIGIIFQDHRLLQDRTVFDNVALPLVITGFTYREICRRVRTVLDKVGLLGKERMLPSVLSGGEQQRVGIARAVVHRPSLVLADEPTGNLDPILSFEVMALFERFNQVGVTILVASHNLELIKRMQKPIITLRDGHVWNPGNTAIDD